MAFDPILPVETYPDDFQIITEYVTAPAATVPLFYVEARNLTTGKDNAYIDSVTILTQAGAAATTVKLVYSASPTGSSSTDITGTISTAAAGIGTASLTSSYNNVVPSGNVVCAVFAGTTTGLACTIQVRFRSRPK